MIQTIRKAWGIPELRKKIIFTLLILLIFRIGNAITVPYIDTAALKMQLDTMGTTYFGLLNAMSGGGSSSKSAGSEDFAYVSQEVPSIMLALASGQPEKGYGYPQHHPMVKFDESVLAGGSAVYAYTALRWLEDHNG